MFSCRQTLCFNASRIETCYITMFIPVGEHYIVPIALAGHLQILTLWQIIDLHTLAISLTESRYIYIYIYWYIYIYISLSLSLFNILFSDRKLSFLTPSLHRYMLFIRLPENLHIFTFRTYLCFNFIWLKTVTCWSFLWPEIRIILLHQWPEIII